MTARTSSAPRTSRAAKGAAANKAATTPKAPKATTAVAVIEAEDIVLEGVIVDDVPTTDAADDTTATKKARIDHSTHKHASSKAARAKCRADLKKAAAASEAK